MMQMRWSLKPNSTKRQATTSQYTPGSNRPATMTAPPQPSLQPPPYPPAPAFAPKMSGIEESTKDGDTPASRVAERIFPITSSSPRDLSSPDLLLNFNMNRDAHRSDTASEPFALSVRSSPATAPPPEAVSALLGLRSHSAKSNLDAYRQAVGVAAPRQMAISSRDVTPPPIVRAHSSSSMSGLARMHSFASTARETSAIEPDVRASASSSSDLDTKSVSTSCDEGGGRPCAPLLNDAIEGELGRGRGSARSDVLLKDVIDYEIAADGSVLLKGEHGGFLGTLSKSGKTSPSKKLQMASESDSASEQRPVSMSAVGRDATPNERLEGHSHAMHKRKQLHATYGAALYPRPEIKRSCASDEDLALTGPPRRPTPLAIDLATSRGGDQDHLVAGRGPPRDFAALCQRPTSGGTACPNHAHHERTIQIAPRLV